MFSDRIYHYHFRPIGTLIKSSPNQIAYLCDKEYTNRNDYFQIVGFQNRCPSFMIPEVLEWYFKRERISNQLYYQEIYKIESMLELANFYHMIQFGTIPNFYLGYIKKDVNEQFKNYVKYTVVFYTDFKSINSSGVKLEFLFLHNKKEKTFNLNEVLCSSDYKSNFYASTNDAMITKISLMNALAYKYETQIGNSVYLEIYKELRETLDNTRNLVCIDHPINYDKFRWYSEKDTYPFNMDNNFCRICVDKDLNQPFYFKSYLTCICTDTIVTLPIVKILDGIIDIEDPFKNNSYLNGVQFISSNKHPDFNIYYQLNPFFKSYKQDIEESTDKINLINYQFNKDVSTELLGTSIFDSIFIEAISINHPLASVVYINSTRNLINKIVDNIIHKFAILNQLEEQGMEPISINEKEGKILIKQKETDTTDILLPDQMKNMTQEELEKYMNNLLKNSPNNGLIN